VHFNSGQYINSIKKANESWLAKVTGSPDDATRDAGLPMQIIAKISF